MDKIILFGDVHGCYEEWRDLIEKIAPGKDDLLISVGDLICKGPSSKKTLDFAQSLPRLKCVVGNHELHFLKAWKNKRLEELTKDYQKRTLAEFGKDLNRYMEWIETWPYYLDLPECIVVHGGLRAGVALQDQKREELTSLRHLENGTPWYEAYQGKKLVVYGHWARQGLRVRENTIGLDSGCVYGRELSALILPAREIVQLKAKKVYQEPDSKKED